MLTLGQSLCHAGFRSTRTGPDNAPIEQFAPASGWQQANSAGRNGMLPSLEVMLKPLHLFCVPLLLTACQNLPSAEPALSTISSEGHAFAQASCGQCHAIGRYGTSSNSNALPFPAIVNQEGLTAKTLSVWLKGAHNYPREMDFYLGANEVDKLVAYMLTLRDPNYRRPPD